MMSKDIERYFENLHFKINEAYDLARKARLKGFDPINNVEIPLVKNMAEKVVEFYKKARGSFKNPQHKKIGRIPMTISPKQVMLIEGYLALWDGDVRSLLDCKIYFDLDYETRIKRRTKFMDAVYQEKVLIPMHQQYVETTKQYADHIVDVSNLSSEQVTERVEEIIKPLLKKL